MFLIIPFIRHPPLSCHAVATQLPHSCHTVATGKTKRFSGSMASRHFNKINKLSFPDRAFARKLYVLPCGNCVATVWQLCGNCVATAWQLRGDCAAGITNARLLVLAVLKMFCVIRNAMGWPNAIPQKTSTSFNLFMFFYCTIYRLPFPLVSPTLFET
jgi:hypothetical protein